MNVAELCAHIKELEIPHVRYLEALNLTYAHLTLAQKSSVIMLAGPTRVGKTRLVDALSEKLICANNKNSSQIPILRLEAATTDQGFMSTKYLKLRLLEGLRHPMFQPGRLGPRISMSETSLQMYLNRALECRGTRFLIIDEGHHLLRSKNARLVGNALDNIKCIGNENDVVIMLSGGYELLATCFDSAHLNGRLTLVDFGRYKPTAKDALNFDRILSTLYALLPWKSGASLYGSRELLYEGTLGCCGLVVGWALRALATMQGSGDRVLTIRHFLESRYKRQLEAIGFEIEQGEAMLTQFAAYHSESTSSSAVIEAPPSRRSRPRRPGKRLPTRDPTDTAL